MTKNFDLKIVDLDGKPVSDGGTDLTAAVVCAAALLNGGDDKTPTAEKVTRYELAVRVRKGGDVDLTVDELKLISDSVGKMYTPIVVGQVLPFLNK